MKKGEAFWCQGTISTNAILLNVHGAIINSSGTEVYYYDGSPETRSFDILNDKMDAEFLFALLPVGSYTYKITASDSTGSTKQFTSSFTVASSGVSDLEAKRPNKANLIGFKTTYEEGETIEFAWDSSDSKATHYALYIDKVENGAENVYDYSLHDKTGGVDRVTKTLPVGNYGVRVVAYTSNYWEADRSDWLHAAYDIVYFSVRGKSTVAVTFDANGGE